jgi:hypothetical protein
MAIKVEFSKDINSSYPIAVGNFEPFKTCNFDVRADHKTGVVNKLCHVQDMPISCSYTKQRGKDFILNARAGFLREETTVSLNSTNSEEFVQISPTILAPANQN